MELLSAGIAEAPLAPGRVRLVAEVAYDDRRGRPEQYWFDAPEKYADRLSVSGNPWLACLLPLAVTRGEALRLNLPVDPKLLANARRVIEIWASWGRGRPIPVEAEARLTPTGAAEARTGAFFSGGVDSFYMVLRDGTLPIEPPIPRIDALLCIWGFDIRIDAPEEFRRLRERLAIAADALGKELVDVGTNLRSTRFREADWGRLSHGAALAGAGLSLEGLFRTLLIAGTHSDGPLRPWGSHPETDPLFSTSSTRVVHADSGVRRREKTEFVARSEIAMRSLHVCYSGSSADNCGNCRKCLLAMLTLELAGVRERCETLRGHRLELDRVERLYLRSPAYRRLYRDLALHARAAGRRDIATAVERAVGRSRRMKPVLRALEWLEARRGFWRLARALRLRTFGDSIQ